MSSVHTAKPLADGGKLDDVLSRHFLGYKRGHQPGYYQTYIRSGFIICIKHIRANARPLPLRYFLYSHSVLPICLPIFQCDRPKGFPLSVY